MDQFLNETTSVKKITDCVVDDRATVGYFQTIHIQSLPYNFTTATSYNLWSVNQRINPILENITFGVEKLDFIYPNIITSLKKILC